MPRDSSWSATCKVVSWLLAAPATAAQRSCITLCPFSTGPTPQGAKISQGVLINASLVTGLASNCSIASRTRPGSRSLTSSSAPTACSCSASA
ncbi:hypothetical protein D3C80_1497740 [compost metagenome]